MTILFNILSIPYLIVTKDIVEITVLPKSKSKRSAKNRFGRWQIFKKALVCGILESDIIYNLSYSCNIR